MFHSLNALRVIAEFWVVRLHIGTDVANPHYIEVLTDDLMSFFFVLSGFVCMYSQKDTNFNHWTSKKNFILKKLRKSYPIYLFWYIATCIGRMSEQKLSCSWFWWCFFADLIMISPWSYCGQTVNMRGAAWYITTLFSIWVFFPFIKSLYEKYAPGYEWTKISFLYLISNAQWIFLYFFPWHRPNFVQIPALRFAEFSMGSMIFFTLQKPLHFCIPWVVLSVLVTYYIAECLWIPELEKDCPNDNAFVFTECGPVDFNMTMINQRCFAKYSVFKSRFSIFWAVIIHWCATKELNASCPEILDFQIFKSLSVFSLQLYLGHFAIGVTIRDLTAEWGKHYPDVKLAADLRTLLVYALCYATYKYLQPVLDKIGDYAFPFSPESPTDSPELLS